MRDSVREPADRQEQLRQLRDDVPDEQHLLGGDVPMRRALHRLLGGVRAALEHKQPLRSLRHGVPSQRDLLVEHLPVPDRADALQQSWRVDLRGPRDGRSELRDLRDRVSVDNVLLESRVPPVRHRHGLSAPRQSKPKATKGVDRLSAGARAALLELR